MRVEPGAHEEELGAEALGKHLERRREAARVCRVSRSLRQGHVLRRAAAAARPLFVGGARARVERIPVDREIRHAPVVPEQLLRAIAVVHVEIGHENARDSVMLEKVLRGNRDRVQEAEPHGARLQRVMARRPRRHENRRRAPRDDRARRGERQRHGAERRLERGGRDRVVGAVEERERPRRALRGAAAQVGEALHVRGVVDALDRLQGSFRGVRRLDGPTVLPKRLDDDLDAMRGLRVIRAGVVTEDDRIEIHRDGPHDPNVLQPWATIAA